MRRVESSVIWGVPWKTWARNITSNWKLLIGGRLYNFLFKLSFNFFPFVNNNKRSLKVWNVVGIFKSNLQHKIQAGPAKKSDKIKKKTCLWHIDYHCCSYLGSPNEKWGQSIMEKAVVNCFINQNTLSIETGDRMSFIFLLHRGNAMHCVVCSRLNRFGGKFERVRCKKF